MGIYLAGAEHGEPPSESRGAKALPHCMQKLAASGFTCAQEGQAFIVVGYSIPMTPTQVLTGLKISKNIRFFET